MFRPLDKEALDKIVDIEMGYVNGRLREQGIEVELSPEAKSLFVEKGFDPAFGARPLKRVIQRFLEDPLAEDMIKGTFSKRTKKEEIVKIKALRHNEELKFE